MIETTWWPSGVPDSIRSAMLKYLPPPTAPLIEHINNAFNRRVLSFQGFTILELLELNRRENWGMSKSAFDRILRNKKSAIFFVKFDPICIKNGKVSKNEINSHSRGRRPFYFKPNTTRDIVNLLIMEVQGQVIDHLTKQAPKFDTTALKEAGIDARVAQNIAPLLTHLAQQAAITGHNIHPVNLNNRIVDWINQQTSTPLLVDAQLNNTSNVK